LSKTNHLAIYIYSGSKNYSYSTHFFLSLSDTQQWTNVESCAIHHCVRHSLLSMCTNFQVKILFLWSALKKIGKCICILMSKNYSYSYTFLPISSLRYIQLHEITYHSKEKIVLHTTDWKIRQIDNGMILETSIYRKPSGISGKS